MTDDLSVGSGSSKGGAFDASSQAPVQKANLDISFAAAAGAGLEKVSGAAKSKAIGMKMEKMVYQEIGRVVQPPSAPAEKSPEKPPEKKCHQCDRPYGDDANFCAGCGANLKEPSKKKKDGSPSRKGHRRGSSKGKPADEFPNKAYNGELPEPPPAHLARAGKYEGQLDDGVRHGHGKCVFPTGDVYEGAFRNGMRHGAGVYTYKRRPGKQRQRVYEGEWRRSKRHGEGKETWEDGTVYEGAFADDAFHGLGTYRTPFAKYRGNFEAGYKSGQGSVVYYKSKDTYDGEWRRNRFHGVGTYYWGNNTKYEGQWEDGARTGFGVFLEPSGEKHEGHWKSNEKHGAGTTRTRNGKCRDGVWKHGRFVVWSGSEYFGSSSSAMHAVGNKLGGDRLKGADEKKSFV